MLRRLFVDLSSEMVLSFMEAEIDEPHGSKVGDSDKLSIWFRFCQSVRLGNWRWQSRNIY